MGYREFKIIMLRLRYIIASIVLLASGMYFTSNVSSISQAEESSSKDDGVLENTFFTLNRATSSFYLQKLAELTASEALGQNVKVVVE